MKESKILVSVLGIICIITIFFAQALSAQGYGGSLTFQGLDHYTLHSAATRAMGGVSIGIKQDIGLMFQNPATLPSIKKIQVSLGGQYFSEDLKQEQEYAPVRYYPNLSLLLEGRTARIPDPDTSLFGFTAQDTVQRPYDDIGPNWSRSKNDNIPIQGHLAVPILLGNVKIVAGIGVVEYANLDHFYQNNNVLSPDILSARPLPTMRPTDDEPIEVDWLQTVRSRKGSIRGYGFALAIGSEKSNTSFGLSYMFLKGSTHDYEQQLKRGKLTFFSNAFRLDSMYSRITKMGTSDFSGHEFTVSSKISGRYISFGFSLKLVPKIIRKYTMQVETDTTGTPSISMISGEDKLTLPGLWSERKEKWKVPWRGIIGLSLTPKENLVLGIEYEFRRYEHYRYVTSDGTETSPWLPASLFRVGAEYLVTSWLSLRGGMRGQAEVFQSEGNKLEGDPVKYRIFSAGLGVFYLGFRLNVAYENSLMKYEDIWSSAISKNSEQIHTIIADLSYEIPWIW